MFLLVLSSRSRLAPSPGRHKRKHAQDECDELHIEFLAAQALDAEASNELTMQERLYQAKMKRIEKSQAGKRHGSPVEITRWLLWDPF